MRLRMITTIVITVASPPRPTPPSPPKAQPVSRSLTKPTLTADAESRLRRFRSSGLLVERRSHSYSGDGKNITIDVKPGGCWCEALKDGGFVRHMTVEQAASRRAPGLQRRLRPARVHGRRSGHMIVSIQAEGRRLARQADLRQSAATIAKTSRTSPRASMVSSTKLSSATRTSHRPENLKLDDRIFDPSARKHEAQLPKPQCRQRKACREARGSAPARLSRSRNALRKFPPRPSHEGDAVAVTAERERNARIVRQFADRRRQPPRRRDEAAPRMRRLDAARTPGTICPIRRSSKRSHRRAASRAPRRVAAPAEQQPLVRQHPQIGQMRARVRRGRLRAPTLRASIRRRSAGASSRCSRAPASRARRAPGSIPPEATRSRRRSRALRATLPPAVTSR